MTDSVDSEGAVAPDANVSLPNEHEADAEVQATGNEADSSPAAKKAGDDVTEKVRSRIDELTKHRREAERERDAERRDKEYWREQAMRGQRQEPEPKAETPKVSKAKTLADFEYDEAKYQDYLFERAEQRAVEAAERRLKEQEERNAAQRRQSQFVQRMQEFSKTVDDFREVTGNPSLPITPQMAEVIADSDEGPALAYFLGRNLEQADRISQLEPLAAARELGRLEERLITERAKAKEKAKVSNTPPPPPKIDAADSTVKVSTTSPESDSMSDDAWVKAETDRLKRKARR